MTRQIPVAKRVDEIVHENYGITRQVHELISRTVCMALTVALSVPNVKEAVFAHMPDSWQTPSWVMGQEFKGNFDKEQFVAQWLYEQVRKELGYEEQNPA